MEQFTDTLTSSAIILGANSNAEIICGASGRISTTQGTALQVYNKSIVSPNNTKLIGKVLSSGHKSLIEHAFFNIAFNNVSVFVEQFIIEFRLSSFTVQSRRYVNFKDVGYFIPSELNDEQRQAYSANMEGLFDSYQQLIDCGVPKEDARFVLPYCFKSNFFCSCNARELLHIICSLKYGRGRDVEELSTLGSQLEEQFNRYFPNVVDSEKANYSADESAIISRAVNKQQIVKSKVSILSAPSDATKLLQAVCDVDDLDVANVVGKLRKRELEMLNYVFSIKDISLSGLTHLVRHRMLSIIVPSVTEAINNNRYIMPQSIAANNQALEIYNRAFATNTAFATEFVKTCGCQVIQYLSLSGNTLNVTVGMNARELYHYLQLRTCQRAQWEIRNISIEMLQKLIVCDSRVFCHFGPSCVSAGKCPEGAMTCGKASEVIKFFNGEIDNISK